MRQSLAALAVIRRQENGQTLWLTQWNAAWDAYALVGGHRHADESFRACLLREVREELDLRHGQDFTAAEQPLAHLEYTAWSQSAHEETAYTLELFVVQLTGAAALQKVNADPHNRWLSEAEMRCGRTADGRPVSPTLVRILAALEQP